MTEEHFNELTPAEDERLAKLAEECGEVVVIVMKIMRHGYNNYHPDDPDTTNRELLMKELSDVLAAVEHMSDEGDIDGDDVLTGIAHSAFMAKKYEHHQDRSQ